MIPSFECSPGGQRSAGDQSQAGDKANEEKVICNETIRDKLLLYIFFFPKVTCAKWKST